MLEKSAVWWYHGLMEVFFMAFTDKKAAFAYVNEYQKEKYDRITIMAAKGRKAEYRAAAAKAGMSLSAFVEMCVNEKIGRAEE